MRFESQAVRVYLSIFVMGLSAGIGSQLVGCGDDDDSDGETTGRTDRTTTGDTDPFDNNTTFTDPTGFGTGNTDDTTGDTGAGETTVLCDAPVGEAIKCAQDYCKTTAGAADAYCSTYLQACSVNAEAPSCKFFPIGAVDCNRADLRANATCRRDEVFECNPATGKPTFDIEVAIGRCIAAGGDDGGDTDSPTGDDDDDDDDLTGGPVLRCASNVDCASPKKCDPIKLVCVNDIPTDCALNPQICTGNTQCVGRTCQEIDCRTQPTICVAPTSECGTDGKCKAPTETSCITTPSLCTTGQRCNAQGVCEAACNPPANPPLDSACVDNLTCAATCDCPTGYLCLSGTCKSQHCKCPTRVCTAPSTCNETTGKCEVSGDGSCPGGRPTTINGQPVNGANAASCNLTKSCTKDCDCPEFFNCYSGSCQNRHCVCFGCNTDETCNLEFGTCDPN